MKHEPGYTAALLAACLMSFVLGLGVGMMM